MQRITVAPRARLIGPHRGGRVTAVAGHPGEPQIFYFGHCAGGVWKTPNGGRFWESISDGFFKTGAVGALAIAEADPNVIIVGMGETNTEATSRTGTVSTVQPTPDARGDTSD